MHAFLNSEPLLAMYTHVRVPRLLRLRPKPFWRVLPALTGKNGKASSSRLASLEWSRQLATSLRIDVELPPAEVQRDLAALHERMRRPGDALNGLPALPIDYLGLHFRYREADGEHYVYVEDPAHDCLAGVTVFNRLIELNRLQDRHLRASHSRYAAAYQRRGIATAIYRWWLAEGRCLLSGARQSPAAHALWQKLASSHTLLYVDLRDKQLTLLGKQITSSQREDLHTRMLMLGQGFDLPTFAMTVKMQVV